MVEMHSLKVKVTFIEDVLGTCSANPDIHREYIASKSPDHKTREEEVEAIGVDEAIEKSMTVFPRENGIPFFWDYQWKGFFKDTCSALSRTPNSLSSKLKAFKKVIDGCIFVEPRKVMINLSVEITNCQRPLRGQTAQGERIALSNSEAVPAGSTCEFEVKMINQDHEKYVREWLEFGVYKGTGQWRNSGKGRFTVEFM